MEAVELVTKAKTETKRTHYESIDGLRGLAVLLVLFHHFLPPAFIVPFKLGNIGVDIFFVLSGFLITGILLNYKNTKTLSGSLKTFYRRRIVRIFPIYYLYLVIVLFTIPLPAEVFLWAGIYVLNFYTMFTGIFPTGLGHFWSLAVEEQFYLVWPFVILLVPVRFLLPLMTGLIIVSSLFSLSLTSDIDILMHPLSCAQALVFGGILSLAKPTIKKAGLWVILTGLAVALCVWADVPIRAANTLFGGALIIALTTGDFMPWFFKSKVMVFIGEISYGIYVYHMIFSEMDMRLAAYVRGMGVPFVSEHPVTVVVPILFLLTIIAAHFSYMFIEQPILKLKDRWK